MIKEIVEELNDRPIISAQVAKIIAGVAVALLGFQAVWTFDANAEIARLTQNLEQRERVELQTQRAILELVQEVRYLRQELAQTNNNVARLNALQERQLR